MTTARHFIQKMTEINDAKLELIANSIASVCKSFGVEFKDDIKLCIQEHLRVIPNDAVIQDVTPDNLGAVIARNNQREKEYMEQEQTRACERAKEHVCNILLNLRRPLPRTIYDDLERNPKLKDAYQVAIDDLNQADPNSEYIYALKTKSKSHTELVRKLRNEPPKKTWWTKLREGSVLTTIGV